MYHGEMEDWLNGICSDMEIVGKCLKFLINKDFFFIKKKYYIEYFQSWYIIIILYFFIKYEKLLEISL